MFSFPSGQLAQAAIPSMLKRELMQTLDCCSIGQVD